MSKINRKELIDLIQANTPVDDKGAHWSKVDCEIALDAIIKTLTDNIVDGNEINIQGFGAFGISERKARNAINPKTQAKIVVPATVVPKFKASKNLKDMVAGK